VRLIASTWPLFVTRFVAIRPVPSSSGAANNVSKLYELPSHVVGVANPLSQVVEHAVTSPGHVLHVHRHLVMPAFSSELLESLLEDFEYLIDLPRISLTVARWQCLCIYDSQTDRETDKKTDRRISEPLAILTAILWTSAPGSLLTSPTPLARMMPFVTTYAIACGRCSTTRFPTSCTVETSVRISMSRMLYEAAHSPSAFKRPTTLPSVCFACPFQRTTKCYTSSQSCCLWPCTPAKPRMSTSLPSEHGAILRIGGPIRVGPAPQPMPLDRCFRPAVHDGSARCQVWPGVGSVPCCNQTRTLITTDLNSLLKSSEDKSTQMKSNRCPEGSGLVAEMLKTGDCTLLKILCDIFNQILLGKAAPPEVWKRTVFIVIHKSGDVRMLQNYRPIAVISILYKLFAGVVYMRISAMLEQNQCPDQVGFRRGYSTVDHLFSLTLLHQKTQEHQMNLWIPAVDFRKAFDTIEHDGL
jgi:hypothetical protein